MTGSFPIAVIPTGVDDELIGCGVGQTTRMRFDIPNGSLLMGHVGRLAEEKNLDFLCEAFCEALAIDPHAHAIIIGAGPKMDDMRTIFENANVANRIHIPGVLEGQDLSNAYDAIDVFGFSSFSETQGLVLIEAMAQGTPVVALYTPGVREVVSITNVWLLPSETKPADFADAMLTFRDGYAEMASAALATANAYNTSAMAYQMLDFYRIASTAHRPTLGAVEGWGAYRRLTGDLRIVAAIAKAASHSVVA